jgi:hypothetical protein
MFYCHFKQFVDLGVEMHLNSCFKRYVFFVLEFRLVEPKELRPMEQLIQNLLEQASLGEHYREALTGPEKPKPPPPQADAGLDALNASAGSGSGSAS